MTAEERLETESPPQWKEVPDLMMENEDGEESNKASGKRKQEKVARGWWKQQREEDIWVEKRERPHYETPCKCKLDGFYSEEWGKEQQEEDHWQVQDKKEKIVQMVFHDGLPDIHLDEIECTSGSYTQHQGGGCSIQSGARASTQADDKGLCDL